MGVKPFELIREVYIMNKKTKAIICNSCGASQFKHITHDGRSVLECEFCGTQYEDDDVLVSDSEALPDDSINAVGATGAYVVYGHLNVNGCNNCIRLCKTTPDSATTVRNLNINGIENYLSVRLMPGATKSVRGVNNIVR